MFAASDASRPKSVRNCLRARSVPKGLSASLVMITLPVTDADAASNRWCATTPKRSENCGYATLDQCRAYVLGLGGWCRPNPFRDGVWD